ncbi:MAG: hypothetical protein ACRDKH_05295 [Solirubrobacterales bacterium]
MTAALAPTLAAIRPNEWELPLFLHVLSALVLIGAVVLALLALMGIWRGGPGAWRYTYLTISWVALPAWIVLRLTSEWILDKEGLQDAELEWIDIGFSIAEPTFLLLIIAAVIARVKKGQAEDGAAPGWGGRIATGLVSTCLLGLLFALWAMTTKPV